MGGGGGVGVGGGTRRDAGGVLDKRENSNSNKLIPQNSVRSVGLNRSSRDRQTDTDRETERHIFQRRKLLFVPVWLLGTLLFIIFFHHF